MPAPQLPDALLSEVDAIVNAELATSAVPGAAVGIVHDGALAGFRSYGEVKLGGGEAPSKRSIARVASVTKTFTATAIMQLRDASLLELDDPLLLHIPEFTNAQAVAGPLEAVTIRRMLTHRSGLTTENPATDWDTPDFPLREQLMGSLEQLQIVIPQDSQWKYSNLAYGLLGEVISRLSGKSYEEYMYEEIIGPLGLENTVFDLSPEQQALKMTGYSPPKPGETEFRVAPIGHLNGLAAAGQLQTNVEDLAKWIGFQLGSGPDSVLSAQSLAELHRPVYIENDWSSGQCPSWRATRRGERVYLNHGGGVHGFTTNVYFNIPARAGVIVLVNVWPHHWLSELPINIAEAVIDGVSPPPVVGKAPTPGAPTEFDGTYWAEPGILLSVEPAANGIAFAKPAPGESVLHSPSSLEPVGAEDSFRVVDGRGAGETIVFSRDGSGKIAEVVLGGFRYRKID